MRKGSAGSRQDSALGSAINQAMRQFGSVIGVAIAVALLGTEHGASTAEGFIPACSLMAAGGLLTGLLSLPLSRRAPVPCATASVRCCAPA